MSVEGTPVFAPLSKRFDSTQRDEKVPLHGACRSASTASEEPPLIFRDPDRPLGERVTDLLGRLTLAEKVGLLHQHQAAVERLGVPAFPPGPEALPGLAWPGPAPVFPQAVGLGTSWDPELVRAVGAAVGDEVRAFHHAHPEVAGLNVWAPVVN